MNIVNVRGLESSPMPMLGQLAVFCGGSDDSFIGDLLRLMRKADPGNIARLKNAFPDEYLALRLWEKLSPVTFGALADAWHQQKSIDPHLRDV